MSGYAEPSLSASVDRGYSAGPSETTTVPPDSAESDTSYIPTNYPGNSGNIPEIIVPSRHRGYFL